MALSGPGLTAFSTKASKLAILVIAEKNQRKFESTGNADRIYRVKVCGERSCKNSHAELIEARLMW